VTASVRVVFENAHVVAADKPSGVLTVPSRMGEDDARPCFGRQLEAALGLRLWPVHRLDFEVSGLVLFAKTAEAHRVAGMAFESRRVAKGYEALTEGAERVGALPRDFVWESLLVRGKRRSFEAAHGKPARTLATARALVSAAEAGVTGAAQLVHFRLAPETGRPHQLRVHLARAGFAVAGDQLYGAQSKLAPDTIALRSVRLEVLDERDRRALDLGPPIVVPGFGA
jgi:tRNA pseudouridine32 synthase/23S rRNA pseudouridine746 synthase